MARIEFVTQSERDDDYRAGNSSRLINLYPEPLGPNGKAPHVLKGVPRANDFVTMPNLFVRDMAEIGNKFYVMAGGELFRVTEGGTVSALGTTVSAAGAMIFGAELGKVCTIVDGRYFVWNGTDMVEPDPGFASGSFTSEFTGEFG